MSDLVDKIFDNIEKFGLSVITVGGSADNDTPPFSYSIGLSLKEESELLCESLPPDLSQYLINEIAAQLPKHGIGIDHSCVVRGLVQNNMPIALVEVDEEDIRDTRTIQVSNLIDVDDYKVLQVILPDPAGRFPWEEGHDDSMGVQNIHRKDPSAQALNMLMEASPRHVVSRVDKAPTKH